jgi:hypothetical protein
VIAEVGRGDSNAVIRTLTTHANHLDKPYRWLRCLFSPSPEESDEAMAKAVLLDYCNIGICDRVIVG